MIDSLLIAYVDERLKRLEAAFHKNGPDSIIPDAYFNGAVDELIELKKLVEYKMLRDQEDAKND